MINKMGLPLFLAGLFAATVLFAPCAANAAQGGSATTIEFSAQQEQEHRGKPQKAAPAARPAQPRVAPQRAAPQRATPRVAAPQRAAPRTVTQPKATSRVVRQPKATSRTVTQPKATSRVVRQPKATSRTVTQPKATSRVVRQPKTTPKTVAPAAGRKVVSPAVAPRVVTPRGARTVTTSRLRGVPARGAGRAVIRGQNYSVWRSGYRVRHGSGWRTFVALSALGAIIIGSSNYYPYAYISAPEPYCEGLTEDGCQLMWQEVETIEDDVVNQCVAYCPWQ
jgi:hypothetical protein